MNRSAFLILAVTSSLSFHAVAAAVETPATGPGSTAPTAAAVEAPPEDMLKLRDPFHRQGQALSNVPRTELEMYTLEQIKMVGVLTGPDHMRAMLIAPNGKTYFVAEKTKIGQRQGVITKILPDKIKIREKIVNVLGQEENVDAEITLPPDAKMVGSTGRSRSQGTQ